MKQLNAASREAQIRKVSRIPDTEAGQHFLNQFGRWVALHEYNMQVVVQFTAGFGASEFKLYVPDAEWKHFARTAYHAISQRRRLSFNEIGDERFSFFLDVDGVPGTDDAALEEFVMEMWKQLPDLFGYEVWVWARRADGRTNFHVNVPYLKVTRREALRIVRGWDLVDVAPLRQGTLRHAYSYKLRPGSTDATLPYEEVRRFRLGANVQELAADEGELWRPFYMSLLHFQPTAHAGFGLDWWFSNPQFHNKWNSPVGRHPDPSIYSMEWWNFRFPARADVARILQEELRLVGGEFEDDSDERLWQRVFEYFNKFFAVVEGDVVYGAMASVTKLFDWTNGREIVSKTLRPATVARNRFLQSQQQWEFSVPYSKEQGYDRHGNPRMVTKSIKVDFLKEWFKKEGYKPFASSASSSLFPADRRFNLYNGPGNFLWDSVAWVKSNPQLAISCVEKWRNFLRTVICCNPNEGDPDAPYNLYTFQCVEHFICNEVQTPHEKFGWILYLFTEQTGVGKSFFQNILTLLVGADNTYNTVGLEQVLGKFGGSAAHATLVNFAESNMDSYTPQQREQMWSNLKALTTDDTTVREEKYKDPKSTKLVGSITVSSNHRMKIARTDRRLMVVECNSNAPNIPDTVKELHELLVEQNGIHALHFYYDGLLRDPTFTTTVRPAMGKAKRSFVLSGLDCFEKWLWASVEDGMNIGTYETPTASCPEYMRNEEFWHWRRNDEERGDNWYRVFSITSLHSEIKRSTKIGKGRLMEYVKDFFWGDSHFKFFKNGRIKYGASESNGVMVNGNVSTVTYLKLPTRDHVLARLQSRLGDTEVPHYEFSNENVYRDLWPALEELNLEVPDEAPGGEPEVMDWEEH